MYTRWAKRILYGLLAIVILDVVAESAWSLWFRATHKAPLGRTAQAVTRTLNRAIPPGTLADGRIVRWSSEVLLTGL